MAEESSPGIYDEDSAICNEAVPASACDDEPSSSTDQRQYDNDISDISRRVEAANILESPSSSSLSSQDSAKKKNNSYQLGNNRNFSGGIFIGNVKRLTVNAPSSSSLCSVHIQNAEDAELNFRDESTSVAESSESEARTSIPFPETFQNPGGYVSERTITYVSDTPELQANYRRLARRLSLHESEISDFERQRNCHNWHPDEIVIRILHAWHKRTAEPTRKCLAEILCDLGFQESINVLMACYMKE